MIEVVADIGAVCYFLTGLLLYWIVTGVYRDELREGFLKAGIGPVTFTITSWLFILGWPVAVYVGIRRNHE